MIFLVEEDLPDDAHFYRNLPYINRSAKYFKR